MQIQHYDTGRAFLDAAGPFLYQDEILNGILIGVAARAAEHTVAGESPYLATVTHAGAICLAAVMTPPRRLLVNIDDGESKVTLQVLAQDLRAQNRVLPGVTARLEVADSFAGIWQTCLPCRLRRGMALMVFELRRVRPPKGVSGQARWARPEEINLLVDWLYAFNREVGELPRPDRDQLQQSVIRRIHQQELLVWEDNSEPVSVAGRSRPSPHGEAISCVRTPPQFRRHGYASACVAALSQHILDTGKQFCSLFTDLANPTPNHIYQEIGYRPRGEFVELHFDAA